MNELITIENNVPILDIDTANQIVEFIRKAKEIKDAETALREKILKEMEEKKIKTIKTEEFSITYKDGYEKEKFDSKGFRADYPDLYDSYVSMTHCNPSILIKMMEDKGLTVTEITFWIPLRERESRFGSRMVTSSQEISCLMLILANID